MEIKQGPYTFVEAGILGRTRGIDGFIYCHFKEDLQTFQEEINFIFLYDGGSPFPLHIKEKKFKKGFLIKFTGKVPIEQLKKWSNQAVYLNNADLPGKISQSEPKNQLTFLNNYSFTDIESGIQGKITELIEYPHQIMAEVTLKDHTTIIPLHETYINEIDRKNNHIELELPEGLLKLNK